MIFVFIGLFFAIALVFIAAPAADLVSGAQVSPPLLLILGAGSYLVVTAIHQPSAMLLNDSKGLWFQAACVVLVATTTVALIIFSVPYLGAAAPYLCMSACMFVLQVIPSIRMAYRRINQQSSPSRNQARFSLR
ncbi:hypothetical protein NtRootA1_38510 [Arthrobacter sp. NtRootA1]|nr:hypothetical protein NtRootA1_38510 [Arthrobacter sp. NtRootA1]